MNYRTLDLNLLIALNALLQRRSVSAAAEMLHIGQPACSAALSRLRDHFGDELLVSVSRRMVPTPLALQLEESVREMIGRAEQISNQRAGFEPAKAEHHFRIVCSDLVAQVALTDVIRKLQTVAPGISVAIHSSTAIRSTRMPVGEALERLGYDFVVMPERYAPGNFPQMKLFTTTYRCVAWKHNAHLSGDLTIDDFYGMKHVATTFADGRVISIESDDSLGERRNRRIAILSENFLSVPAIIKGTNYIATLPTPLARAWADRYELALFDIPFAQPSTSEVLVWPRHHDDDAASQWFRNLIGSCVAPT